MSDLKTSLETPSKIYQHLSPKWEKTRIIYKGEDAVHGAGDLLLDRLEQQTTEMYEAYVNRTRFLNAFKRTIKGLCGTVKRKAYDIDIKGLEDYTKNIDLAGTTLQQYSDKLLIEVLKIGVCGTLVDYNKKSSEEVTIAVAEKLNHRPKLSFYISDSILKIEYGNYNGIYKENLIVLKELYTISIDEFSSKTLDQYRVLRLNDDGIYEQQLYKIDENNRVIEEDSFIPEINGEVFDYIPFFLHGEFVEPPLYDIVTTNIKHYQLKADHNHVLHFIGLPQPIRTGVDPDDPKLPNTIGSPVIWNLQNENAKAFYLELEGKGISAITDELKIIKEDLAFFGAEMVAPTSVEETATKSNYNNASETSSLLELVFDLSESFTKALKLFSEWSGNPNQDVFFHYNLDYDISRLSAQEITSRILGWQSGAYSKESLYLQLKNGKVEMASDNFEDEQDKIGKLT